MPKELNDKQKKKLEQAVIDGKITDKTSLSVFRLVSDMEDRLDEEIPKIADVISRVRGDKGDKGDKGDQGEKGERGEEGAQGIQGTQGKDGIKGDKGDKGEDGSNGKDGKDGTNGNDGKDGKDGSPDTATQIADKLNTLEEAVDQKVIKGLTKKITDLSSNIVHNAVSESAKIYTGTSETRVRELITKYGGTGSGGGTWGSITGTLSSQTDLQSALNAKQDTLVSGTNIKTVNGSSLLGSGDLSCLTVGTSTITSGTTTRILYDNAGTLGEYTITGDGTVVAMANNPRFTTNGGVWITPTASASSFLLFDNINGTHAIDLAVPITGDRTINFPNASGTLALTANKLSAFAATTSSELAGVISDETGSGALVFGTSPTIGTPFIDQVNGSASSGGTLTLNSTTHATKGKIFFGSASVYDQVNNRVGINNTTPANTMDVIFGTAGTMGKGTYEMASFERSGDAKFGVYTSDTTFGSGASLTFGYTNKTDTNGYYPGFELQNIGNLTPSDNLMRINFLGRDSAGVVQKATVAVIAIYADGRVVLTPSSAYVTVQPLFGVGNMPTASLDAAASTTSNASLRIRSGTAPTSPNDGDIWYDGANLKMRVGGATKTFTLT